MGWGEEDINGNVDVLVLARSLIHRMVWGGCVEQMKMRRMTCDFLQSVILEEGGEER